MKEKIKKFTKDILIMIIVMVVASNIISIYKSQDLNDQPYSLSRLKTIDGKTFSFPHAKPLIVHFWATWCPACKLEASSIEKLSKDFEVITIAVNSGEDRQIESFMRQRELSYAVVNDRNAEIAHSLNISAYPTTLIYDKEKSLLFSEVGYTSEWGLRIRALWAGL